MGARLSPVLNPVGRSFRHSDRVQASSHASEKIGVRKNSSWFLLTIFFFYLSRVTLVHRSNASSRAFFA